MARRNWVQVRKATKIDSAILSLMEKFAYGYESVTLAPLPIKILCAPLLLLFLPILGICLNICSQIAVEDGFVCELDD